MTSRSSSLPSRSPADRVINLRASVAEHSTASSSSSSSSPTAPSSNSSSKNPSSARPNPSSSSDLKKRKRILLIGGIAFVVGVFGAILFALFLRGPAFTGERVALVLEGPREVSSGATAVVDVRVRNGEATVINDIVLELAYPAELSEIQAEPSATTMSGERTGSWQLGSLQPGQEVVVRIQGRASGTPGAGIRMTGSVHYTPRGASTVYTAEGVVTLALSPARVAITTSIPSSVTPDGELTYRVRVANQEAAALNDVTVRIETPAEFTVTKQTPLPAGASSEWKLDSLAPGTAETFELVGTVQGEAGQDVLFVASAGFLDPNGTFASQERRQDAVRIVRVGARLDLSMQGEKTTSARPGDVVSFALQYENTGSQPIHRANIEIPFSGAVEALDPASLNVERGEAVNGSTVRFTSDTLPDLVRIDPGKGGRLAFSVRLANPIQAKQGEHNLELQLQPTLTGRTDPAAGEEVEVNGSELTFRIGTSASLDVTAYYYDEKGKTLGAGPIPPVVGKKTTYVIRTLLSNTTNAVEDTTITYRLAGRVDLKELGDASAGKLVQKRDGQIVWELGRLPEEVGTTLPQLEASFTVEVLPRAADVGKTLSLLTSAAFVGRDAFADLDVRLSADPLDTSLPEDEHAEGEGLVKKAPADED